MVFSFDQPPIHSTIVLVSLGPLVEERREINPRLELLDFKKTPCGKRWDKNGKGYFVVELFVCLCCCFFVFSVEVFVIFE